MANLPPSKKRKAIRKPSEAVPLAEAIVPVVKKLAKQRVKKKPSKRATPVAAMPTPDPTPDDIVFPTGIGEDMISGRVMLHFTTFAAEYIESGDCAEAAKKAGYVGKNAQAQKAIGGAMLRNPFIRTMIEAQLRSIIAKTGATPERVWEEISYIAFVDPAGAYSATGEPLPVPDIPEPVRRAMTGYKIVEKTFGEDGGSIEKEIKFSGKDAALDKLIKLHRMIDNDKFVIVSGEEFEKRMAEGRERARVRQQPVR